ncbi:hypothetical protein SDC9_12788 [bioreactor metagenome]|jgi:hypothetical protein|uniref:Uncharacterized protein n=1 Tax=bioreactor metagenome TaxID=1076179 RepID=A0A644TJG5_9ZZZZ|nr:hypothetical protein [Acidaminococcaceae bacterium]
MNMAKIGDRASSKESIETLRERYDDRYKKAKRKMLEIEGTCKRHCFTKVLREIFAILLFLIITYGFVILKNIEYSVTSGEMTSFSEIISRMID